MKFLKTVKVKTKLCLALLLIFAGTLYSAAKAKATDDLFVARPECASNDLFNCGNADTVFRGKGLFSVDKGFIFRPDFGDLHRGKLSVSSDAAPFAVHVVNVVLISTRKDVDRIAARRVIASVASDRPRGHWPVDGFPSKDMGRLSTGVSGAVLGTQHHYLTIPVFAQVASPRPAIISAAFLDFLPESQFRRLSSEKIGAVATAKLRPAAIHNAFPDVERIKAVLTGPGSSGFMLSGHFNSPKVDLVRGIGARQRSGISLKTKPLYNRTTWTNRENIAEPLQNCTLRVMGAIANCAGSSVLWTTQTATTSIAHFRLETYAGVYTLGPDKRAFLIPSGCSTGGAVRVVEVRTDGTTCSLDFSGNLPHSRSCSDPACSGGAGAGVTVVSSANFRGSVARNSLVSLFPDPGQSFTDQAAYAPSLPLPTSLAGVTVEVEGQLCGLVAVTAGQINLFLPPWLDSGPSEVTAIVRTTRGTAAQYIGRPQLNPSAPGIFTLASNGNGPAALNWLVVKPNGQQIWQTSLSYNAADQVFLVLYGTGINEIEATLYADGRSYQAVFVGDSWMPGCQQLNFKIAPNTLWQGTVGAYVQVGVPGRSWQSQGFDLKR